MIEFTAGTTRPFRATLRNSDRSAVDLGLIGPPDTRAVVTFLMRPTRGGAPLSASCAILQALDALTGRILDKGRVEWLMPGGADPNRRVYRGQFRVTFVDGTVEYFPSDEYEDVVVLPAA